MRRGGRRRVNQTWYRSARHDVCRADSETANRAGAGNAGASVLYCFELPRPPRFMPMIRPTSSRTQPECRRRLRAGGRLLAICALLAGLAACDDPPVAPPPGPPPPRAPVVQPSVQSPTVTAQRVAPWVSAERKLIIAADMLRRAPLIGLELPTPSPMTPFATLVAQFDDPLIDATTGLIGFKPRHLRLERYGSHRSFVLAAVGDGTHGAPGGRLSVQVSRGEIIVERPAPVRQAIARATRARDAAWEPLKWVAALRVLLDTRFLLQQRLLEIGPDGRCTFDSRTPIELVWEEIGMSSDALPLGLTAANFRLTFFDTYSYAFGVLAEPTSANPLGPMRGEERLITRTDWWPHDYTAASRADFLARRDRPAGDPLRPPPVVSRPDGDAGSRPDRPRPDSDGPPADAPEPLAEPAPPATSDWRELPGEPARPAGRANLAISATVDVAPHDRLPDDFTVDADAVQAALSDAFVIAGLPVTDDPSRATVTVTVAVRFELLRASTFLKEVLSADLQASATVTIRDHRTVVREATLRTISQYRNNVWERLRDRLIESAAGLIARHASELIPAER
jgi:hypothetical protein